MPDSTTPVGAAAHGVPLRGLAGATASSIDTGRFGRMFRHLPTYDIADRSLVALGEAMIQQLEDGELDKPLGAQDDDENVSQLDGALRLPAGYTYFGQFVDHDITFDPVSSLERQNDPDALTDYRTPRFDLDNIYGRGPADQPYLYAADGVHLALGRSVSDNPEFSGPDLPRVDSGRAIIGDPRNDENLIVSQLQATMLQFHNAVLDIVAQANPAAAAHPDDTFKLAQRTVRWHYQWIVIHDFLRRLVGDEVIGDILPNQPYAVPETDPPLGTVALAKPRLRFYHWREAPFMPVEFSVAAYRFGHSIVRPSYLINDIAKTDPPVQGAARIPLFSQTGQPKQDLNGFRPLPDDWGVQWKFFLPNIGPGQENLPQPSYKLDATISHPLGALPDAVAGPEVVSAGFDPTIAQILAVRNLLRGKRLGLPSGPDVARAMGITPLTDDQLFSGLTIDQGSQDDLAGRQPLWFYILKEAELLTGAAHLGPVGGRIVAEVLIGLLAGDPLSYLSVEPNWVPDLLPAATAGTFTLSDLVNIARSQPGGPEPPPPYNPGG
jgi:hypothetical protein